MNRSEVINSYIEEIDLYKEYKHAYNKAHELEFFDKLQEALYYYEYLNDPLNKKMDGQNYE